MVPTAASTAVLWKTCAIIDGGSGARVEVTADGGRTTSTVAPIPRPLERRGFQATFVSLGVGYLVTLNRGRLYRTDDAAKTWHQVNPPLR